MRHPQRIHAARLVKDLRDMTAFFEDRHAKIVVLDRGGPPAVEGGRAAHGRYYDHERACSRAHAGGIPYQS
jgi:hypothetical protein